MIVIYGQTSSGKTTTLNKLEDRGFIVIPTYTTRPVRPDGDTGTIHIEPERFKELLENGAFLTYATYEASFGKCSYGIRIRDLAYPTRNRVIIGAIEYVEDFRRYIHETGTDKLFQVFLDVSDETIIKMAAKNQKHNHRVDASKDTIARLARDHDKNVKLKKMSDVVVPNFNMNMSADEVASVIIEEYKKVLGRRRI